MKYGIVSLAITGALAALSAAPAQAEPYYPWCAQYTGGAHGIGAVVCSFETHAQCMATVRGMGGFCIANPEDPRVRPPLHSRHRG
jgi:hypothetical protein